ncbi:MAG: ribonuclease P protein component [Rhodanobacteraceae bacterium]
MKSLAAVGPTNFPRAARLLRPADFVGLRARAKRISGQHFRVEVASNNCDGARLGLAVSRRISKSAVCRNRIKRVARDSFRLIRQQLPRLDILLIARASAVGESNDALRADLAQLWRRLATLKLLEGPGTMRG